MINNKKVLERIALIVILIICSDCAFDIINYGAVPNSDNIKDHFINQKAIQKAIQAANSSQIDRVVRIPAKTFYTMPFSFQNMHNISLLILGKISASKSVKFWPKDNKTKYHLNFIQFQNCTNIQISGGGKIDGRGYHWWTILFLDDHKFIIDQNDRPHLIHMENCQFIKIHDIIMKNSPQFHLKMDHCYDAELYNINIKVNTTAQFNLMKKLSLQGIFMMIPFNTDGIDPSGARMHIYNLTVQNYDDVVVPKPSTDLDCTRDMLIQNTSIILGVGMSIGSVPPQVNGNCINNITFRNVNIIRPIKGIYVKTNPGDQGHGNISNIYYQNFTMDRPIWWAIYIGPQQMKEPDGDGPGCMLYPFDKKGTCTTQPRVTLRNITLQNITIRKSLLYPVTIRCNVSNPCRQINFINVKTDSWLIGQKQKGFVCQFATGVGRNNSPTIDCLSQDIQYKLNDKEKIKLQKLQIIGQQSQKQIMKNQQAKNLQYHPKNLKIKELYSKFISLLNKTKDSPFLKIMFKQLEKATFQVGYVQQDDQFDYSLENVYKQFQMHSLNQ